MTAQPKPTAAEWTPGTSRVREAYVRHMRNAFVASTAEHEAEFDRWLAEHDAQVAAQALRQWADAVDQTYPTDVFRPVASTWLAQVHAFCQQHGRTLDAITAHVMRHAARIARQDADRIAGGAT